VATLKASHQERSRHPTIQTIIPTIRNAFGESPLMQEEEFNSQSARFILNFKALAHTTICRWR